MLLQLGGQKFYAAPIATVQNIMRNAALEGMQVWLQDLEYEFPCCLKLYYARCFIDSRSDSLLL